MTQEITAKIQDQLNLSALILKKNHKHTDLSTWSGFDLNDDMQVKQAKRLLKLFGIKKQLSCLFIYVININICNLSKR